MKTSIFLILVMSLGQILPIQADVLEMPEPEQAVPTDTMSFTLPGRGMRKEQVEERFGTPTEKDPAIGQPPITRWVYNNFTVYFEYDIVLHSVLHKH